MNLMQLFATLSLDSSGFQKGIKDAGTTAQQGMGDIQVSSLVASQYFVKALDGMISAVGDFADKCIDVGSKAEIAFKKVSTIADESVVSYGDMKNSIKALSSEMGVSIEEVSDAVYNAISATGDTAGAVELAGTATKLATAGFTDASSSLNVLTTAINAYKMNTSDAEKIADSLLVVQNRGVTTVGELSAVMGKAIASASAYNVDLNNLESAYISLTKGGVNTAESTTYVSSMMKELGDTGSTVGKTLKSQTGKTFSQLMDDGKSLADVLQILEKSVNGDATALMNMWGSAEAGKSANAILSQGVDYFNESLEELRNSTGATQTAYEKMADTFSHRQDLMKTKLENMMGTVFEKMQPLLNKMFDFVDKNIIPLMEKVAEHADVIIPIIAGIGTALGGLGIVALISKISSGMQGFFTMLSANPIMLVVAGIMATVVALTTLYNSSEEFKNFVDNFMTDGAGTISEFVSNLFANIPDLMNQLSTVVIEFISGILAQVPQMLTAGVQLLLSLIEGIVESLPSLLETALNLVISLATAILENAPLILQSGIELIGQLLSGIVSMLPNILTTIVEFIPKIIKKFTEVNWIQIGANIIKGIATGITNAVSGLVSSAINACKSLVDGVKNFFGIQSPSRVMANEVGKFLPMGLAKGINDNMSYVDKAMDSMNDVVLNGVTAKPVADLNAISAGGYSGFGSFNQTINVNQQIDTADELARAVRVESKYGLMRGVEIG